MTIIEKIVENKASRITIIRRSFKHGDGLHLKCPIYDIPVQFVFTEVINVEGEKIRIQVCEHCTTQENPPLSSAEVFARLNKKVIRG